MAITYTVIGEESGQARTSSQDENWRRTYTRHFRAETDNPLIGPKAVRESCPVQIGQVYEADGETDLGAFAVRINVTGDTGTGADGRQWIISIEYGQFNALEIQPADPMIARPKISFSSTRFQVPATKDIDDEPVVNSAGDPFDPPFMLDETRPFMTIVKNEAGFPPLLAQDYHNSINNAPWFGLPELVWKCVDITGDEAQDPDGGRYWVVTYQFEMKRETWVEKLMDVGMREINSSGKKIAITDDRGREVDAPWPLNENGTKKAVGVTAEFMEFHLYKEMDFSALNLDSFYTDLVNAGLLL
jgi:hypothetical protein